MNGSPSPESRIYRTVPPKKDDPNYGLSLTRGIWYLIYYSRKGTTAMMSLKTDDVVFARSERDRLYKKAIKLGRGAKSRKVFYAQEILRDPSSNHGLKFVVAFGGEVHSLDTHQEQLAVREQICHRIVKESTGEPHIRQPRSWLPRSRKELFNRIEAQRRKAV